MTDPRILRAFSVFVRSYTREVLVAGELGELRDVFTVHAFPRISSSSRGTCLDHGYVSYSFIRSPKYREAFKPALSDFSSSRLVISFLTSRSRRERTSFSFLFFFFCYVSLRERLYFPANKRI